MAVRTLLACSQPPASALNNSLWGTSHAGTPLDLTPWPTKTFQSDFSHATVTPDNGAGPWYAPVHSNFGVSAFVPPGGANDPFSASGGVLSITQQYNSGWYSGLMQSVNSSGVGFSQAKGYFECTAAFPNSYGAWPSFWLLGLNSLTSPGTTYAEIDVVEAFGGTGENTTLFTTIHNWTGSADVSDELKATTPANMFDGTQHQYGVVVNDTNIIVYFDRVEIGRHPIYTAAALPKYMIVDLALALTPSMLGDQVMGISNVVVYGP